MDAAKIGLKPGDLITGLAYTTFGGTVYWDKAGVTGRKDPAVDPTLSQIAWEKTHEGKNSPELPADINKIFKAGARQGSQTARTQKLLRDYFLTNVYAPARADVRSA